MYRPITSPLGAGLNTLKARGKRNNSVMDLDVHACARLLQTINSNCMINQGRQIHLLFLKRGLLQSATTLGNRLLQMYTRCGHLSDAHNLFDEMPQRNCFTWNSLIEGYMKSGYKKESLKLFDVMPHKNDFSWNLVISGFVKVAELDIARRVFDEMPRKNGIAWNCMIHGCVQNGRPMEALRLFKDLQSDICEPSRSDVFVLTTVIGICSELREFEWGKQIHGRLVVDGVEFDSVLGSSLVNMYGKCRDLDSASQVLNALSDTDDFSRSALISGYANCGRINDAERIFYIVREPSAVIWNTMIAAYISNSKAQEAFLLFVKMRRNGVWEDSSTFASVLNSCSSLGILEHGIQMHAHIFKFGVIDDLIVASALVDAYAKCGRPSSAYTVYTELGTYDTILLNSMITISFSCGKVEEAKHIFHNIPSKSLISWNSMIVGLSQNGCPIEALDIFREMNDLGLSTDGVCLASVISTCASISSLELGEQVFARATIIGLDFDQIISTSLIDFYCKCGVVDRGRKLFDQMRKSDEASWNSMLMGYATNGYGIEALDLFKEMRCTGVVPTDITFIGVLSACSHCGLVEAAQKWFYAMNHDYHIDPGIEHYSCMVDLFARVGRLEEAMNFIKKIPFEPDASMWSSVLRGCIAHGDMILGKKVAEKITKIDPKNSDAYVQLSSIYAASGDWQSSERVRKIMKDKRIPKIPGRSWANH